MRRIRVRPLRPEDVEEGATVYTAHTLRAATQTLTTGEPATVHQWTVEKVKPAKRDKFHRAERFHSLAHIKMIEGSEHSIGVILDWGHVHHDGHDDCPTCGKRSWECDGVPFGDVTDDPKVIGLANGATAAPDRWFFETADDDGVEVDVLEVECHVVTVRIVVPVELAADDAAALAYVEEQVTAALPDSCTVVVGKRARPQTEARWHLFPSGDDITPLTLDHVDGVPGWMGDVENYGPLSKYPANGIPLPNAMADMARQLQEVRERRERDLVASRRRR